MLQIWLSEQIDESSEFMHIAPVKARFQKSKVKPLPYLPVNNA